MRQFPCGCSLTKSSYQTCREHYEGEPYAAVWEALERLQELHIDLLVPCEALLNTDYYHFAARMSSSELRAIEMIRAAITKATQIDRI